jgi:hypothetical protein
MLNEGTCCFFNHDIIMSCSRLGLWLIAVSCALPAEQKKQETIAIIGSALRNDENKRTNEQRERELREQIKKMRRSSNSKTGPSDALG